MTSCSFLVKGAPLADRALNTRPPAQCPQILGFPGQVEAED